MNMCLDFELYVVDRVILTKAEGISTQVYPVISVFVQDSTCK